MKKLDLDHEVSGPESQKELLQTLCLRCKRIYSTSKHQQCCSRNDKSESMNKAYQLIKEQNNENRGTDLPPQ